MDLETFVDVYDVFEDVKLSKVQYYLGLATLEIDPEVYGIHTSKAIGLLTAHYLTLNPSKTVTPAQIAALGFKTGDVKSIEIQEDIKVDFNQTAAAGSAVDSSSGSGLDATVYGQQLEALKQSLIIPFTFT